MSFRVTYISLSLSLPLVDGNGVGGGGHSTKFMIRSARGREEETMGTRYVVPLVGCNLVPRFRIREPNAKSREIWGRD